MALKPSRTAAITAGILAALVALVCLRLGFWQLDRLELRREVNASITRAAAYRPVELAGALVDSISVDPTSFEFRSVRAIGSFEAPPLLIRGRSLNGRPGVHLVSPFRLPGGELVLVNRGWLPSADGATVDPRPYLLTGPQSIDATVQPLAETGEDVRRSELPLPGYRVPSFLRVNRLVVTRELGEEPLPIILHLSERPENAAELPVPLPPPSLDEGPHLGYAIQWFSFAVIAIAGSLTLAFRRSR